MNAASAYSNLLNDAKRTPDVLNALVRVRNHAANVVALHKAGEDIGEAVEMLEDRIARADSEAAA